MDTSDVEGLKRCNTSRHAADSCSWLSFSLLGWRLNLFRIAPGAKCNNIPVTFSMFHFPLNLDRSPCRVLYLSPPRCRLSHHWWCHSCLKTIPARTTKGALGSKKLLPVVVVVEYRADMVTKTGLLWSLIINSFLPQRSCVTCRPSLQKMDYKWHTRTHTQGF